MIHKGQFKIPGAEIKSLADQFSAMAGMARPVWAAQASSGQFRPVSAV